MGKRIALTVLALALVTSWGVIPAMACDSTVQIKQAGELLRKAETQTKSAETKALIEEARKILSGRPAEAVPVQKAKSTGEFAEEAEFLGRP